MSGTTNSASGRWGAVALFLEAVPARALAGALSAVPSHHGLGAVLASSTGGDWAPLWAVVAGLGGGVVGACATIWATRRTLKDQAAQTDAARERAAHDSFTDAAARAFREVATAASLLGANDKPSLPFFLFDHRAIDDLLSYGRLPAQLAQALEGLAYGLRAFNAAAAYANPRLPDPQAARPAQFRWRDATAAAQTAVEEFTSWREAQQALLAAPVITGSARRGFRRR